MQSQCNELKELSIVTTVTINRFTSNFKFPIEVHLTKTILLNASTVTICLLVTLNYHCGVMSKKETFKC